VKTEFEKLISGVLVEGYGLSEAPTATHCNPILGINKVGSIGLPLPDVICKIVNLDDPMVEVPVGTEGELLILGPQVMAGYLNHDEENTIALQDGWLHTGDIALMDADGYFFIKGRKKDLIKVGGLQVWPQEIEEVISIHPSVKEVAVAGVPDKFLGEKPVAWIVRKENTELNIDEIKQICKENLAGFKQPLDFLSVTSLPRTTIGKLLRRELIASYKK
jgi:long-chain acyl-CoA synthetase